MKSKKMFMMVALLALAMPFFAGALNVPTLTGVAGEGITMLEIANIIQAIASWLVIIAVVIAVIMIVWGGIMWMVAAGDEDKVGKAKSMVWNGILGAAVVLAVGVILQTVSAIVTRTFFPA